MSVDITGKTIRDILVIERITDVSLGGRVIYRCKCEHDHEFVIDYTRLHNKKNICSQCYHNQRSLIGQTFGKLLVIDQFWKQGKNKKLEIIRCKCDCGEIIETVRWQLLKNGQSYCKKCKRDITSLIGCRFGKLVVASFDSIDKDKISNWRCICDCGRERIVPGNYLKLERVKDCGNHNFGKEHNQWEGYGELSKTYFTQIKFGALDRGISFNITIEEIWKLFEYQNGKCAISGTNLVFSKVATQHNVQTASLDRIDNQLGYIASNIQWVHRDVNQMRWEWTVNEFLNWCKIIIEKDKSSYKFEFIEQKNHQNFTGYKLISGNFWSQIKASAKERNIKFNLSIIEVWDKFEKQNGRCYITNLPILLFTKMCDCQKRTASLDRINSILEYTSDNIGWVHKEINQMKHKLSLITFLDWCQKIYDFNNLANRTLI